MFSVVSQSLRRQNGGLDRRELLRVGGLSLLGLTSAELGRLRCAAAADSKAGQRQHRSCVFLFLFGGPSQIDLWDMKPDAPQEIRGDFQPVSTSVPGIQLCEHLPMLAGQMDKVCLLRSMTHNMNVHGPACSEIFSGRDYFGAPITDQALPEARKSTRPKSRHSTAWYVRKASAWSLEAKAASMGAGHT